MNRNQALAQIRTEKCWDFVVIGGGATGLGVAVDAASRGYKVLLVEQADFAKGTSSRSTKLIHGGVRYLAQGHVGLVREGLRERGFLLQNAPHLVKPLPFVIPIYSWKDAAMLWSGMKIYDMLAGQWRIGQSAWLSRAKVLEMMPGVQPSGLKGGVLYYDAQFDDARLAVHLAQTCVDQGGVVVNYMQAERFRAGSADHTHLVSLRDQETNELFEVSARVVINATGVFVDELIQLLTGDASRRPTVRPSQGVHVVLPIHFTGSARQAMLIPRTADGRVIFLVPWHNRLLAGTTDTAVDAPTLDPRPFPEEVDFILQQAAAYLSHPPHRKDVLSVFAGLRPLALPSHGGRATKDISRKHHLRVDAPGLITITGGKWTTYRKMAEDTVNLATRVAGLPPRKCVTQSLRIHGWMQVEHTSPDEYGSDRTRIQEMIRQHPETGQCLDQEWPYTVAEVIWAVQAEMARTVEDILARRFRVLFLDAHAAIRMAPKVAQIMRDILQETKEWELSQTQSFIGLAEKYLITNGEKRMSFKKVNST
ncbi:glycerol-3-phosphate dehydrogenase/oxidase [Thermoflavifilum thermophilum]|uniref:Glycerol-3-phosphate dehydrogenase n=1 Tax=Thermoflavifilum thermophilum TaxID=1393122 RepID=A0A1I7MZE1_9BACT|nr:glycerol-3-phosphate dehydrogenase/oxidase [Thermoflavifilum thermophilum]SFV27779.1 glycerol-3-phosphate dehydrogenase [Thermoflavifilum thermophilum]